MGPEKQQAALLSTQPLADSEPTSKSTKNHEEMAIFEGEWDGGICDFGGRPHECGSQTWSTICLTLWCPCVVFGLNMRRAFLESSWAHGVAFFVITFGAPTALLVLLFVYLYGTSIPAIQAATTESDFNAAVATFKRNIIIVYCCAILCIYLGILYGFLMRMRMAKKFGIREHGCISCLTWIFCHACALCQERRTLLKNVDEGAWTARPAAMLSSSLQATTTPPKLANMDAIV